MKKIMLLLAFFAIGLTTLMAQTREITGKVTSADDGGVMPGVSVSVKGTSLGTISDMDGVFRLRIPTDAKTLVFSFVGMESQELAVGTQLTYNVQLKSQDIAVDEVVVVGYGTQNKRDVTSSISKVKGDDLADKAGSSFAQQLAGRAAGVQITSSSGDLGTPPNIRIRGVNTISSGSQPLIVVNGVPSTSGNIGGTYTNNNPLADINPSDIESIEILKDGAATAIYGSRASNGVILVTTKKGSVQKTKVSYDAWYANSKASKLYDLLDAEQFVTIANEKYKNKIGRASCRGRV